jgi:gamma-glutamylputrescine oxidase
MLLQDWWYTTLLDAPVGAQPPLVGDVETDVVVVGAGAAGLAAALRLSASGRSVVLLERNICGGSSTGKSAGFLTPDSELELSQLVRRYGVRGARDLWECAQRGIDLLVSTATANGIACDLRKQDSLFLGIGRSGWRDAQKEVAARDALDYPQTVYAKEDLPKVLGSSAFEGGVRYPGTFGVNAMLYAQGVKALLLKRGVRVHESSEVVSWSGRTVRTHLGSVTARAIVFCIDKPTRAMSPYARSVYHAQTFLSVSEPLRRDEKDALFPDEPLQCWDSRLVYSYWRLTGDDRLLLGGGSALSTFSAEDVDSPRVIRSVIKRFQRDFPALRDLEFVQYWPGRIDTTRDLMPTVVRDPQHPWVHFVLGCVGLPWATFAGDFVARHVLDDAGQDDHRYYGYFAAKRRFFLPTWSEGLLSKQIVFSLNNAWAKYRQVDEGRLPTVGPTDF